jgi:hypothetical protein
MARHRPGWDPRFDPGRLLALYVLSEEKLGTATSVSRPQESLPPMRSIAHEHLVDTMGLCKECHGQDLSGTVVDEG